MQAKQETAMDDYLKEALEIVKAQASVRTMTEEEITSMVKKTGPRHPGHCRGFLAGEQ
jgi:hypothetical protein